MELPAFIPDSAARYNVLVLHGEVEGMLPAAVADRAGLEIKRADLGSRWDYIALGHYHVYREIAPNAFYSGSIDYTSANPWGELSEQRMAGVPGKGIVERNLDTGEQLFHAIAPARPLVDLPPVNARGLAAAELNERIRATVESAPGGIENKIVRLTVREVPRHMGRELDHKTIREYKRRALNFHLDLRRPEAAHRQAAGGPGGGRRQVDLKEVVLEKLRARPLDADVDRETLLARASQYIDEAQAITAAAPLLVDG
jgi:DNA repair exonuclease SbcCD nuclease subunit